MNAKLSPLLISQERKTLYAFYTLSVILNSLCMICAVLIGATEGVVPIDGWYQNIEPVHVFYLAEALFITFLPLFVVTSLNIVMLSYITKRKGHSLIGTLSRIILGVILVFPLLYIAVAFYIFCGFFISWWEIRIVQSGIAAGFLVFYHFYTSTVMADNPKQHFLDCVSNPAFWIILFLLTGILLLPSAMLVNPLHKGLVTAA